MLVRRITGNISGVTTVEFAMITPVLFMMICGFMEYAYVSSARSTLEAATMRAARALAASNCPASRPAMLTTIIQGGMDGFILAEGANVEISTKAYGNSFGDVGEPEPFIDENNNGVWDTGESYTDVNENGQHDNDMGTVGSIGGPGQVVTYSASVRLASLFGFVSNRFNGGNNSYLLEANTVIRNEPVFRSGCA